MIQTIETTIEVMCDECGFAETYSGEDWKSAFAESKSDNWKTLNVDGEWSHFCAECKVTY